MYFFPVSAGKENLPSTSVRTMPLKAPEISIETPTRGSFFWLDTFPEIRPFWAKEARENKRAIVVKIVRILTG